MARILSIIILPLLLFGVVAYFLPEAPVAAKKVITRVTETITNKLAPEDSTVSSPAPTVYEQLVVPTVTVGPEQAQSPELRIWAIRNDRNYGWIQLPRGTPVYYVRQDGDYYIVRYEETIIRAHRSLIDSGTLILKKTKTYAMAY